MRGYLLVTFIYLLSAVFLVVLVGYLISTTSSERGERGDEGLVVGATIFPLADIVREIGGEHIKVVLIIPPGVSEHSGALAPQQLNELREAQAIFQIGHGLDTTLTERVRRAFPNIRTVTVDAGILLREFEGEEEGHADDEEAGDEHRHDEGVDPHYWLTVPNAVIMAANISNTLVEIDPAHANDFRRNLFQYQQELEFLETYLQDMAGQMPRKEFIAMHNAWSYFAEQYGLDLVATYEPVEGKEPAISDIRHLQEVVERYGITAFYAEPQKAVTAATRFLREEFGLTILTLDPLGGTRDTNSYAAMMRFNMEALASGVR